jgi:hypothetical protein
MARQGPNATVGVEEDARIIPAPKLGPGDAFAGLSRLGGPRFLDAISRCAMSS